MILCKKRAIKILTLLFGIWILHCGFLQASASPQDLNSFGEQVLRNQTIQNLNHSGHIEIADTTIRGTATINGTINVKNSRFSELFVNGDIVIDDSTVSKNLTVNGSMDADNSRFEAAVRINGMIAAESSQFSQGITVHGNHAEFEECKLHSLQIKKPQGVALQEVYLEETIVQGDIVFEQEGGVVLIDSQSKIMGSLKGGTIKQA